VVEVRKAEQDGATVAPATNQEDTKAAPAALSGIRHVVSDFHVQLLLMGLCSEGQGCCGLLQARIAGFLLCGVRYRDKNVGSGLLDEAQTGHQEVSIAVIEPDVRLRRSVGGEAKRRAHNVRHGLSFGLANGFGGVLAAVTFVKSLVCLCSAQHKRTYVALKIMLRSNADKAY